MRGKNKTPSAFHTQLSIYDHSIIQFNVYRLNPPLRDKIQIWSSVPGFFTKMRPLNSGLLISIGRTTREAPISKDPDKFLE
jgi:hypothetical protein